MFLDEILFIDLWPLGDVDLVFDPSWRQMSTVFELYDTKRSRLDELRLKSTPHFGLDAILSVVDNHPWLRAFAKCI